MTLIEDDECRVVAAIAALTDCNPFLPARVALEEEVLGGNFIPLGAAWHAGGDAAPSDPNLPRLRQRVEHVAGEMHRRLAAGVRADDDAGEQRSLNNTRRVNDVPPTTIDAPPSRQAPPA